MLVPCYHHVLHVIIFVWTRASKGKRRGTGGKGLKFGELPSPPTAHCMLRSSKSNAGPTRSRRGCILHQSGPSALSRQAEGETSLVGRQGLEREREGRSARAQGSELPSSPITSPCTERSARTIRIEHAPSQLTCKMLLSPEILSRCDDAFFRTAATLSCDPDLTSPVYPLTH